MCIRIDPEPPLTVAVLPVRTASELYSLRGWVHSFQLTWTGRGGMPQPGVGVAPPYSKTDGDVFENINPL